MAFKFPNINWAKLQGKIKLPVLGRAQAKASAALVIRPKQVQLLFIEGKQPAKCIFVPIEGESDEQLIQALTKAVSEAMLKTKRVAVAINSPEVLLRCFAMPSIPKSEWETAVQFEARKYIPFKMSELAWDYQVANAGTNQMEAVFTALPLGVCGRYTKALEAAGLEPTVIEPMGAALARLMTVVTDKAVEEGCVCLVDVEQTKALLVITKQGLPYLTRDVQLASGTESPTQPDLPRLISELRVSIDFFTREHPSTTVSRVVLFGQEALLQSWVELLAEQLQRPVVLGKAWLGSQKEGIPLSFGAACGLLGAGQAKSAAVLDFLRRSGGPSAAKPASQTLNLSSQDLVKLAQHPQAVGAVAVSAAAAVLAVWLFGQQQVDKVSRQFRQLQAGQPQVPAILAGKDENALKKLETSYKEQLDFLKAFNNERANVAGKLDALARSLPDGVWLTNVTFENRVDPAGKSSGSTKLSLNGACFLGGNGQELGAIQEFERRIRRNAALGGIGVTQLGNIAAQADTQKQSFRTFQLNCQSTKKL